MQGITKGMRLAVSKRGERLDQRSEGNRSFRIVPARRQNGAGLRVEKKKRDAGAVEIADQSSFGGLVEQRRGSASTIRAGLGAAGGGEQSNHSREDREISYWAHS